MKVRLKNKKLTKLIFILVVSLLSGVLIFWSVLGKVWTGSNFQILDIYYQQAVRYGYGPPSSSRVVYVTITGDSYEYFGENFLDRADMAHVNDALAAFGPEAVAYDIIFAYPSSPLADQQFRASLDNLGSVYLPIGLDSSTQAQAFAWEEGVAYERLRAEYLKQPREKGTPRPLYATQALMQMDDFSEVAFNAGHISAASDPDGVYRHVAMLLKVDSLYFPTLTLAMFLDYMHVPFEDILVDWGRAIVIPTTANSFFDRDVIIPIDAHGRVFIPYVQVWGQDFESMDVHDLLRYREDEDLQGNLAEFFEGNFVLVGDVSVGISDIGATPLEQGAPLVMVHASLLNGLLTQTFYRKWSLWHVYGLICLLGLLLGLAALPRASLVLYLTGGVVCLGIVGLTWLQFIHFVLLPLVTVGGSFLVMFFGLVIGLQVAVSKDQAFIRDAFSKYVPEKVVHELLVHPELLQLGGEERVLTVLFSDVEGFTTIAENLSPADLVSLLNEYLTEMTDIILAAGGIVDKYEGDAIMAEFGAPLMMPNHADMAVRAGLSMQRRLGELRQTWDKRGLPALKCRVGVNTGSMILGNMGSHQVFDYTVMGDAVNLASRLEGANKRYQTYMMISEFTYTYLSPDLFRARILDVIRVKGKSQAVKVFEVYGETCETIDPNDLWYYETYHEAFEAYLAHKFVVAREQFALALSLRSGDPAAQVMIERIDTLHPHDLPDDWDGSVALISK